MLMSSATIHRGLTLRITSHLPLVVAVRKCKNLIKSVNLCSKFVVIEKSLRSDFVVVQSQLRSLSANLQEKGVEARRAEHC